MTTTSPKFSGEPSAKALASGLATLGRYGDEYIVHAAKGETIIPAEVLESNPGLKEDLLWQMKMMGIEDPNRYVVGNTMNSINPDTGLAEFWFHKYFKKVYRAAKKVFKKLAPIVAPIVGNLIAPGIGGIIASGLTTKLQGGSWGDALKSSALSYGAGALTQGIGGALSGTQAGDLLGIAKGGTFMGGLSTGLTSPFQAAGKLFSSGAQNPLAQGIFGPRGTGWAFNNLAGTEANPSKFATSGTLKTGSKLTDRLFPSYQTGATLESMGVNPASGQQILRAPTTPVTAQQLRPTSSPDSVSNWQNEADNMAWTADNSSASPQPFNRSAYIEARAANMNPTDSYQVGLGKVTVAPYQPPSAPAGASPAGASPSGSTSLAASSKAPARLWDGFGGEAAAKIASQSVVPLALAGATYFLTDDQQTQAELVAQLNASNPRRVAYDQWSQIDDKNSPEAQSLLSTWYGQPQYSVADLSSKFGANPIPGITSLAAAGGGEIMGPGTGTSDSIPARLSDGEFVMTAQAVRNAGNGNRDVGAARMYDMMNRFEQGMA
jgi:hypothetical protein|tara:strand:- start:1085 stop:2731 length:1647 start_codon:yes stop_codon:yes gene_type:complete